MLDSWAGQGKIDFVGNVMTLLVGEGGGRSYALEPAVRFLKVIGPEADPNALIAKVKTDDQLRDMGAEHVGDSVVLGDMGYEVQSGFLAEVSALQAAAAAQRAPEVRAEGAVQSSISSISLAPVQIEPTVVPPPSGRADSQESRLPKELEERRKEAEALARFLLDNLS